MESFRILCTMLLPPGLTHDITDDIRVLSGCDTVSKELSQPNQDHLGAQRGKDDSNSSFFPLPGADEL